MANKLNCKVCVCACVYVGGGRGGEGTFLSIYETSMKQIREVGLNQDSRQGVMTGMDEKLGGTTHYG